MRVLTEDRGSAALTTVLLLPFLIIALAGVIELGRLRVSTNRVRAAADIATVVAIGDQDDAALAATGAYRPAPDAATIARVFFARNLDSIASELVDAPDAIADAAAVMVFDGPANDPIDGRRYDRAAVRLSGTVRIKTPGFGALLMPAITSVDVFAASMAR